MKHAVPWMFWLLLFFLPYKSVSAEDTIHYTIKKGDTINEIAKKFGIPVWHISIANNIRDNKIQAGKKLVIPLRVMCNLYNEGMASWYGPGFHGNITKNGEPFNQNGISVALHENLLKKWVLIVLDQEEIDSDGTINGHQLSGSWFVTAPVTDTGSFTTKYNDRVVDLSRGAMHELGGSTAVKAGLIPVKVFVCQ